MTYIEQLLIRGAVDNSDNAQWLALEGQLLSMRLMTSLASISCAGSTLPSNTLQCCFSAKPVRLQLLGARQREAADGAFPAEETDFLCHF